MKKITALFLALLISALMVIPVNADTAYMTKSNALLWTQAGNKDGRIPKGIVVTTDYFKVIKDRDMARITSPLDYFGKYIEVKFLQIPDVATVYVSQNGSDENPCSLKEPCNTIAYAAGLILDGGEIVLRGGVYPENVYRILPSNSTLKSFKGERAIIRPGAGNWALHISYNVENVTVQGIEIDATGTLYDAVKITTYAKNISLIDCDIHGSVSHGVLVSDHAENVSIIGGSVHDNGTSESRHGIYFSGIDSGLVDGVEIYGNAGHAVHIYGGGNGYHNTVRGNYIHDNGAGVGAYYGAVEIENNTIANSGNYLIRLQYALEYAVVSDNDLSYPNPGWTSVYVANLNTENALVTVRGNYIHDSYLGVWVRNNGAENTALVIQSNVIEGSNTPVLVQPTNIEVVQEDNEY